VSFLTDLVSSGQPALKSHAHRWRETALLESSIRKFQASTVTRAVGWTVAEEKIQRAKEEAIARWTKPRPVDRALLAEITRYIDRLPFSPPRREAQPVLPNDHACIGFPRKSGGQAAAAQKLAYDEIEREYQMARDRFTRAASGTYAEAAGWVDHSNVVSHLQSVTLQQREISTSGPTPTEVLEAAREKFLRESDSLPSIEVVPLAELGGKIRVVTLHSVEEVMLARNVTSQWLGQLRRVITTRDILKDRPVVIETTEDGDIFSADLTASTDYISHEVAQHIATLLYERVGAPCNLSSLLRMFGPHVLPDGTRTCSGIHMGLGPTWVILSLLNGFAAWYAGAHKDDHRVCGDDLVGIWRKPVADKYVETLERLGVVVNYSKSFYTEAGVFCEMLVLRTGAGSARAYKVGHLSQASAARVIAGRTRERLCVADGLWSENHIPVLSRETAKSLTPRVRDGGPLRLGGNGRKLASRKQLEAALRLGAVGLVRPAYRLPKGAVARLREAEGESGDVPVTDLLISATTRLRLRDNFRGKKSLQARTVTSKDFLKETGARRRGFRGTKESLLAAIAASSLRSRDRKTAAWLVHRPQLISNTGRSKWLQRTILRPRAQRYVPRDVATAWLQSISPVRWELGPKQQVP